MARLRTLLRSLRTRYLVAYVIGTDVLMLLVILPWDLSALGQTLLHPEQIDRVAAMLLFNIALLLYLCSGMIAAALIGGRGVAYAYLKLRRRIH